MSDKEDRDFRDRAFRVRIRWLEREVERLRKLLQSRLARLETIVAQQFPSNFHVQLLFNQGEWDLSFAVSVLMDCEGRHYDPHLYVRDEVVGYLASLDVPAFRLECARLAISFLDERAIDRGHGLHSVKRLIAWLESQGFTIGQAPASLPPEETRP